MKVFSIAALVANIIFSMVSVVFGVWTVIVSARSEPLDFPVPVYYLLYDGLVAGILALAGSILVFLRARHRSYSITASALSAALTGFLIHAFRFFLVSFTVVAGEVMPFADVVSLILLVVVGFWLLPRGALDLLDSIQYPALEGERASAVRVLRVRLPLIRCVIVLALFCVLTRSVAPFLVFPMGGSASRVVLPHLVIALAAVYVYASVSRKYDHLSAIFWTALAVAGTYLCLAVLNAVLIRSNSLIFESMYLPIFGGICILICFLLVRSSMRVIIAETLSHQDDSV